MLNWLGFEAAATKVETAVNEVLKEGKVLTFDLAPPGTQPSTCSEVGERIAREIQAS
jgi:isocitrate/isopropylmalate dehydrogenase